MGDPQQRQPAAERSPDRHARGGHQRRGVPAQLLREVRALRGQGPTTRGPAAYVLPADDPAARTAGAAHRAHGGSRLRGAPGGRGHRDRRDRLPRRAATSCAWTSPSRGAPTCSSTSSTTTRTTPAPTTMWAGPSARSSTRQTVRVEDTAILDAGMTLVESVTLAGGVEGGRGGTYPRSTTTPTTPWPPSASRIDDLVIHAAEASFTDDDREFNAGHLRDPRVGSPGDGPRHGPGRGWRRVRLHRPPHPLRARGRSARDPARPASPCFIPG